jgi:hypothetical protein
MKMEEEGAFEGFDTYSNLYKFRQAMQFGILNPCCN